jgi:hypothetical protein
MKYVLLLHLPADGPAPDDDEMRSYAELKRQLQDEGVWLGGQALQPAPMTTSVRVRADGPRPRSGVGAAPDEVLVVDGPLAETAEQIAGYYLVDCRDLDEAVAVAARIPGARVGAVEVRPVFDYEALLGDGRTDPA